MCLAAPSSNQKVDVLEADSVLLLPDAMGVAVENWVLLMSLRLGTLSLSAVEAKSLVFDTS